MTGQWPDLAEVRAAGKAIKGIAAKTPVVRSKIDMASGAPLWMKLETLQPTGAFKLRGAANALSRLSPKVRQRGVVCCSTGNHGMALAYAARRMDVQATVCVSELVPAAKLDALQANGAQVVRKGNSQDDAQREVDRLVAQSGLSEIPPFDHRDVIAGQGTIGLELLEAMPDLGCLLVPLSGGGLAAGIAVAAKAIKPDIRIVGISMDRGAAMAESLAAGHPVEVNEVPSLADSLGGGIGLTNQFTFGICRDLLDEVVLLTEAEIYRGMQALFSQDRLVAEGAAAVGHAAILAGKVTPDTPTATIISGQNVDMTQFTTVATGRPVTLGKTVVRGE